MFLYAAAVMSEYTVVTFLCFYQNIFLTVATGNASSDMSLLFMYQTRYFVVSLCLKPLTSLTSWKSNLELDVTVLYCLDAISTFRL